MSPSERADEYWAGVFRVPTAELREPGLHATFVEDAGAGVYVLQLGDTVRVRAPESHRSLLGRLVAKDALDPLWWRAALRDAAPVVLGPARHYLGGRDGLPSSPALSSSTPTDADVEQLAEHVPADEVEESGVLESDALRFGVRQDGTLAAVSVLSPWVGGHTDVGVLVAPPFRGRGLGRAAASIAVSAATRRAGIVRWRCREDNAASVALAERLGLTLYARNLGIRL